MPTRLIELADGTLIEVESNLDHAEEIGGGAAQRVKATMDQVTPLITKACLPLIAACREIDKAERIASAEIELGFGFEAEGSLYIAKAKSTANIVIRISPRLS